MPITLPVVSQRDDRPVVAVLELINHTNAHRDMTLPSWEELHVLEPSCQLFAAVLAQALRAERGELNYERLLHGALTSLQAARWNLEWLEQGGLENVQRSQQEWLIPNTIAWLEELEAQIYRGDQSGQDLLIEPIALYGDILAKLEPMVRRMNTRDDGHRLRLNGLHQPTGGPVRVLRVPGNRRALEFVFRDLLDNSRKYCEPQNDAERVVTLSIEMSNEGDSAIIYVADNGCGIPPVDAPLIFEDGYRGLRACGTTPNGVGQGLFRCAALVKQMGGRLTLAIDRPGTVFRLELRVAPAGPGLGR